MSFFSLAEGFVLAFTTENLVECSKWIPTSSIKTSIMFNSMPTFYHTLNENSNFIAPRQKITRLMKGITEKKVNKQCAAKHLFSMTIVYHNVYFGCLGFCSKKKHNNNHVIHDGTMITKYTTPSLASNWSGKFFQFFLLFDKILNFYFW